MSEIMPNADEEKVCVAWADYLRSLGWSQADIKLATGVECAVPTPTPISGDGPELYDKRGFWPPCNFTRRC
jgi:hypothetical protein